jgi:signal transduction histidine kinase
MGSEAATGAPDALSASSASGERQRVGDAPTCLSLLERLLTLDGTADGGVDAVLDAGLDHLSLDTAVIGRASTVDRVRRRGAIGESADDGERAARALDLLQSSDEPALVVHGSGGEVPTAVAVRMALRGAEGFVIFLADPGRRVQLPVDAALAARVLAHWTAAALEREAATAEATRTHVDLQILLEGILAPVLCLDGAGGTLVANAAGRGARRPESSRSSDAAALRLARPRIQELERWETSEGESRWMRVDRVPFEDAGTGARSLLVVATDVTEAEEKERALAAANEGLNQFAYIASHDLQEPLRKISTFADILVEGIASRHEDDVSYSAKVIKDSARRASALIKDLLSWSQLTNRALDRRPVRMDEAVREIVADILAARPAEAVEVVDTMAPVTLQADPLHVRQLVENLVANAVKYRHPARPPRIVLRLARHGGRATFEIEDNGIGFDPIHADLIFEPFRRLHAEREYTGTGVGLAICARVCERHGWHIEAVGRPGEGALFRVVFGRVDRPLAPVEA